MAEALTAVKGASWIVQKDSSASLELYVFYDPETEDETDIEAAAEAVFPSQYVGFVLRGIEYREHGYGIFRAIGKYTTYQITAEEAGETPIDGFSPPDFSFSIDTVDVNVKTSFEVIDAASAAGRAIPGTTNANMIGWNPDGTVSGVNVPQAVHKFSETHHFANVSGSYKEILKQLAGRVNFDAPFRDHEAGEVLFAGVMGSQIANGLWALTVQFAVLENITGLTIAGLSVTKKGWDYIEWFSSDANNATNKKVERIIDGYRIHRVIRSGDFSLLGIGS